MRVLVAVDAQLFQTPDGKVWTKTIYDYNFWKRYLEIFETVVVVSRIKEVNYNFVKDFLESSGPNVDFYKFPFAVGGKQYLKNLYEFYKISKKISKIEKCAIIRLPSISAMILEYFFRKTKKPYFLEIVADPQNAFYNNYIIKKLLTFHLKRAAVKANGVSYVTKYALQKDFPSYLKKYGENKKHFESFYSTIDLKKDFFGKERNYFDMNKNIKIIHIANNVNNYVKGHDIVIKIAKKLVDSGYNPTVYFIGDGKKRKEFEKLAYDLNIENRIHFLGLLSSASEIRKYLLKADVFLFPTKAEGLPRVIIEAMAVGLPCISTPVNGIPELLSEEYLFNPLDVNGFASKLIELINNPRQLNKMSRENIIKAKEYEASVLTERRNKFYFKLKELVEKV